GKSTARFQRTDGTRGTQEVEPLANYFSGRLKKDYLNGNLVVGGMVSGVVRDIDSTFAPRLADKAGFLGADFIYTWNNRNYSLRGSYSLTDVTGDRRVIAARQQSPAHYFQRPDRGAGSSGFFSNRLDTLATGLRGGGAYMRVAKDA